MVRTKQNFTGKKRHNYSFTKKALHFYLMFLTGISLKNIPLPDNKLLEIVPATVLNRSMYISVTRLTFRYFVLSPLTGYRLYTFESVDFADWKFQQSA